MSTELRLREAVIQTLSIINMKTLWFDVNRKSRTLNLEYTVILTMENYVYNL